MLVPTPVREIMSSPAVTIRPDVAAVDAARRLQDADIGSLVVVEDGQPLGIVTDSDIVALFAAGGEGRGLDVGDFMTTPLITIEASATVEEAAKLLRINDVQKLPVVESGSLVGVITATDLSNYLPQLALEAHERVTRERREFTRPEITYEERDWEFVSYGTEDGLDVGDHVRFSKTITQEDIEQFANVSGDTNRLHLDREFATKTRFGRPIAHGALASGLISAALARLPGLIIYLSQQVTYRAPVEVGERVTASCEVIEELAPGRFRLTTNVFGEDDEMVIEGQAVVLVDPIPGQT
jgi:acyl dehydratase/CBS domain-containing protein